MTLKWAKAKPAAVVLVCEKCPKRTGGDALAKPLKRALKGAHMKIVRTKCLGVCPGKATLLHDSRRPQEWLIVKNGTPIEDVAASLLVETVG